jgi:AcrR family transcriptional regulator
MTSHDEADRPAEKLGSDRLLETAHRLFLTHGYANVSMQQIAEEAGMTKGAPYYHFESKTALFLAVSRQVVKTLQHSLLSPFQTEGTLGDHLRQGMLNVLQTSNGVLSLWISDFMHVIDAPVRAHFTQEVLGGEAFSQLLTPVFSVAAERGELRNIEPPAASRVFMKLLIITMDEEEYLSRLGMPREPDLGTTIDELVRVFLYGVAGRAD